MREFRPMNVRPIVLTLLLAFGLSCVSAANEAPAGAGQPSIKRTVLRRTSVPDSKYEVVLVLVEAPANTSAGRHTHAGAVVGYVVEGEYTMLIEGQPPRQLKTGDSLEVGAGVVHDERTGDRPAKLLAVFTVEKGKPLTTPAP
jgi:quercetin dioxygenase-like cupin family protein